MTSERMTKIGAGSYETADGRYMVIKIDGGFWNLTTVDAEGDRQWCQTFSTKTDAVEAIADCRRDELRAMKRIHLGSAEDLAADILRHRS